jgi:hypothetical protein
MEVRESAAAPPLVAAEALFPRVGIRDEHAAASAHRSSVAAHCTMKNRARDRVFGELASTPFFTASF